MAVDGRSLQDPLALLRAWIDPREDAVLELAADGCVLAWSEGAERLFGCEARTAIGRPLRELLSGRDASADVASMLRADGRFVRSELRPPSGPRLVAQWVSYASTDAATNVRRVTVLLRAKGERQRLARRLREQTTRLEIATSISAEAQNTSGALPRALLEIVAPKLLGPICDGCILWLRDEQDSTWLTAVSLHERDADVERELRASGSRFRADDRGVLGRALRSREPRLGAGDELPTQLPALFSRPPHTACWVPIRSRHDAVGLLCAYRRLPDTQLEHDDLRLLDEIANRVLLALSRQRLTADVLESEQRFAKSFHGNPAGLSITRMSDGLFVDCNQAFASLIGYARSELLGRKVSELGLHDDPELRARLIAELRVRGVQRGRELTLRHRSGRPLPVLIAYDLIDLGQEVCLLSMTIDQSERRQAEDALRFQETLLRDTGRIAQVGGWHFDVKTGEGAWTEELAHIHEVDPKDPIWRQRGIEFYHGEDRNRITRAVQAAIERGEPYDLELQIDTARGHRKWVRTSGRAVFEGGVVTQLRGSMQDITERKLGELRLRAQLDVSRILFESDTLDRAAPEVMRILCELNEWQCALLWQPQEPHDALAVTHAWPPDQPLPDAPSMELVARAAASGEPCQVTSAPSAGQGPCEVCAVPLTAAGGVYGVLQFFAKTCSAVQPASLEALASAGRQLGLFVQQRRSERALQRMNAELEQRVEERTAQLQASNRELEAFSYSVSHDLRAPLRAIGGFALALEEDYGEQLVPEAKRYLQTIQNGVKQMAQLIEDLLALSRLNRVPLQRRTVDTQELVHTVLDELAPQIAGRKVHVALAELPDCHAEPTLLKQVWLNLLSNAFKYTRRRAEAHVSIGYLSAGEHAYFVRDDGTGFDPSYAHKLFGVFERLHDSSEFEGTGVGLAIVQRIIHRHGGRVWAEGTPDQGATFYFTLPPA